MPAPRVGDPTPPIFHLLALEVGVGGNANLSVGVGGNANFSVHVGGNANFSVFRTKCKWFCVAVLYRLIFEACSPSLTTQAHSARRVGHPIVYLFSWQIIK